MSILKMTALRLRAKKGSEFDVDKEKAMELLGDEAVRVLDVRTAEEIAQVEPLVEDAIIIDYHSGDFKERLAELPKDPTYLVV